MFIRALSIFTLIFLFLLNTTYTNESSSSSFIDLKSYDLKLSNKEVNHSITFTKGNYYKLSLDQHTAPIKINIKDNNKRTLGTNHDVRTGKFYDAMVFKCQSTGNYTVQFGSDSKSCSGKCNISFKTI